MDNRIPTISFIEYQKMLMSQEFEYKMKEKGIENPFSAQIRRAHKLFAKRKSPVSETAETTQPQISIEEWNKQRDEYVAREIFKTVGFDEIIFNENIEHLRKELKPCEGAGGQCNLLCPYFPCKGE